MRLSRILVERFRNLTSTHLAPVDRYNVIYGKNGSGKTSLLEAIHFLGVARSFRSHGVRETIQAGENSFRIQGRLIDPTGSEIRLGVEKSRSKTDLKLNGVRISTASELAARFPIIIITPDSHELLQGGPKVRRQMLDWALFHVEQGYLELWHRYYRLLRHRNALLKRQAGNAEIQVWDIELERSALKLDRKRREMVDRYSEYLRPLVELVCSSNVQIDYRSGWRQDREYGASLLENLQQDRQRGFTGSGPHRAELRICTQGRPVSQVLSRGQSKLLITAMLVAQGQMVYEQAGKLSILLIDDLAAELDKFGRGLLGKMVGALPGQVFVTCTEPELLPDGIAEQAKRFHVERGEVVEVLQ